MIERNITPEDMEEYMKFEDECIKKGFTFKSLLEARKKQTAKRLKYSSFYKGHGIRAAVCPACNNTVDFLCTDGMQILMYG